MHTNSEQERHAGPTHIRAIAAPALVDLTEEQVDQVAGGTPPPEATTTPGFGRFTAFQIDYTPINSSAPVFTGNYPPSGRFPSLGRATAENEPIPPCTGCG